MDKSILSKVEDIIGANGLLLQVPGKNIMHADMAVEKDKLNKIDKLFDLLKSNNIKIVRGGVGRKTDKLADIYVEFSDEGIDKSDEILKDIKKDLAK